ncbi:MAG TPA: nuclear transport factor 2 family protein [Thermoanaerobaculia bacterium]|nr:nuclear transport factor 2 family protein [Thermoanaerobaculia bacterium]
MNADLEARQAVVDTLTELFLATDRRDWPAVEGCFAETVTFDMTSLAGGQPARLTPRDISSAWTQGLAPIESVHHQAGNFRVRIDGNEASAFCYAIAYHYRRVVSGRNLRTFVGSYDFHLARDGAQRWRIDLFRFNIKFLDGNLDLHSEDAAG